MAAVEFGLRLHERRGDAPAGELRQRLERSRAAGLAEAGAGGHFTLKGLVQPSDQPELVYELKPRLDGDFKGGLLRTNSWGFRGAEVELEKSPDTFRIVGLGDSFMFGWGVDQDETYLSRLERALGDRGTARFEVLNLAVPGYNTWMEVAAFAARGIVFAPDLVVMHFYRNDLDLPHFMLEPRDSATDSHGLYLLELLRSALESPAESDPSVAQLLPHDRVQRHPERLGRVADAYRHMVGESGYRRAMARLADLTRERSVPVVVVLLDDQFAVGDLVREVAAEHGFFLLEPRQHLLEYLHERGLDGSRWADTFQVSARDQHLNELGHTLLAEALLELLVEHELLGPPRRAVEAGG